MNLRFQHLYFYCRNKQKVEFIKFVTVKLKTSVSPYYYLRPYYCYLYVLSSVVPSHYFYLVFGYKRVVGNSSSLNTLGYPISDDGDELSTSVSQIANLLNRFWCFNPVQNPFSLFVLSSFPYCPLFIPLLYHLGQNRPLSFVRECFFSDDSCSHLLRNVQSPVKFSFTILIIIKKFWIYRLGLKLMSVWDFEYEDLWCECFSVGQLRLLFINLFCKIVLQSFQYYQNKNFCVICMKIVVSFYLFIHDQFRELE